MIVRYYNSRPPFKHETLVVDTQLASRSPVCISLDFTIQTLTSCNQAFEKGNAQIKRQHFSTTLVARYTFSLAGDTNALVRLSVFLQQRLPQYQQLLTEQHDSNARHSPLHPFGSRHRLRYSLLCGTSTRKPQSAAETSTSVLADRFGCVWKKVFET
jgi:hypothetical protein